MESKKLFVKRIHPEARLPTKAYHGDAAWDIASIETRGLPHHTQVEFKTGIAVEIPLGYYGQLMARSSQGKNDLSIHPGVIDSGYRGEITIWIRNHGPEKIIRKGERIAQLLILPVPEFIVEEVSELFPSERGEKNCGSSGK